MSTTLRVRASGTALVQHFERLESGINAFIGRRFAPHPDDPTTFAFVPTEEVAELSVNTKYAAEYRKALRDGDLTPADEFTARWAGIKFDGAKTSKGGADKTTNRTGDA